MKNSRLLLWDIDGTLINTGGAGLRALKDTSKEFLGEDEDLAGIEIAGRTDTGIVRQILEKHGASMTAANVSAFLDGYVELLAVDLPQCAGRVLPGVLQLLTEFDSDSRTVHGLLTGNIARGAQLKLEYYGLWKFFSFGAFGDDHHDRNQLGAVACRRAEEKTGERFAGEQVDVIGDTGHDITCGKVIGARTVAVATGSWSREKLSALQPDFLFDDLGKIEEVIRTLRWRD